MAQHIVDDRQFRRLPQRGHAGLAARVQAHRRVAGGRAARAAAAAELHRTAVALGVGVFQGETFFAEGDLTLRLRQQRGAGLHAHAVAGQVHGAAHAGAFQVGNGQRQIQVQARRAGDFGLLQRALHETVDGRAVDDAQRGGQRALALGLGLHHGVVQLGNAHLHAAEAPARVALHIGLGVAHAQAVVVDPQLAAHLRQRRPGAFVGALQEGRHISQRDAAGLTGKAEGAGARGLERDVLQLALDAHFDVVRLTGDDGVLQVAPRLGQL